MPPYLPGVAQLRLASPALGADGAHEEVDVVVLHSPGRLGEGQRGHVLLAGTDAGVTRSEVLFKIFIMKLEI